MKFMKSSNTCCKSTPLYSYAVKVKYYVNNIYHACIHKCSWKIYIKGRTVHLKYSFSFE